MVMGELAQEAEVLVIGGGPGGYAAAFRAADLGLDVTLVDIADRPGGVCLFRGCIPSKTYLHLSELLHDAAPVDAQLSAHWAEAAPGQDERAQTHERQRDPTQHHRCCTREGDGWFGRRIQRCPQR